MEKKWTGLALAIFFISTSAFAMGKRPTQASGLSHIDSGNINVDWAYKDGNPTYTVNVDLSPIASEVNYHVNCANSAKDLCLPSLADVNFDGQVISGKYPYSNQFVGDFSPDHTVSWNDADGNHSVPVHVKSFQVSVPSAMSFSSGFTMSVTGEPVSNTDPNVYAAGVSLWSGSGGLIGVGGENFLATSNQNNVFQATITQDSFETNYRTQGTYGLILYRVDTQNITVNNSNLVLKVGTSFQSSMDISLNQ